MKKIYKYDLPEEQWDIGVMLTLPVNAQILSAQFQRGTLCLWAMVELVGIDESRTFRVYGTGHELPDSPGKFIATIQEGWFVWHVFEVIK